MGILWDDFNNQQIMGDWEAELMGDSKDHRGINIDGIEALGIALWGMKNGISHN